MNGPSSVGRRFLMTCVVVMTIITAPAADLDWVQLDEAAFSEHITVAVSTVDVAGLTAVADRLTQAVGSDGLPVLPHVSIFLRETAAMAASREDILALGVGLLVASVEPERLAEHLTDGALSVTERHAVWRAYDAVVESGLVLVVQAYASRPDDRHGAESLLTCFQLTRAVRDRLAGLAQPAGGIPPRVVLPRPLRQRLSDHLAAHGVAPQVTTTPLMTELWRHVTDVALLGELKAYQLLAQDRQRAIDLAALASSALAVMNARIETRVDQVLLVHGAQQRRVQQSLRSMGLLQ